MSDKLPVPGFGKNWCSRQSSTTGRRRYYFARGDYYSHVQDDPPTQEDHQEQLRLSEKAKKRKGSSNTTTKRKKKRQVSFNDIEAHGADSNDEAVDQEETRVVTFTEDKRQSIDAAGVDEAIALVNAQHAKEAREAETKRAAYEAAAKAQAYEDVISEQVQRLYNEYRQHQDELVHTAGAVIKDRPAYNRVSLVCSTDRPVYHQEVVGAIFRHIDSACDGSFKDVGVAGEISTDVRIYFEHWDGHTTDAIGQLLSWSGGFTFTSMKIFHAKPRADSGGPRGGPQIILYCPMIPGQKATFELSDTIRSDSCDPFELDLMGNLETCGEGPQKGINFSIVTTTGPSSGCETRRDLEERHLAAQYDIRATLKCGHYECGGREFVQTSQDLYGNSEPDLGAEYETDLRYCSIDVCEVCDD